ncbi:hypothetical protein WN48_04961, partial [Eufriesea mexicana]
LPGDRVTCTSSDPRRLPEDTFYTWFSFDELMSYEEDMRLRTEDREEEDEEFEDRLGMSSASTNKLQSLWHHFIHAKRQSNEKSYWLDIFLAEFLAQVKEGQDAKDVLSFCSVSGGSVSTLIACELLSDVHELSAKRIDGDELARLRKYLTQDRGWRCLAFLHLFGVRGLSGGRELVALLIALYPVAFQEETSNKADSVPSNVSTYPLADGTTHNPYVKFYCNDDTVDTVDIVSHVKRKAVKSNRNGVFYDGNAPSERRVGHRLIGTKLPAHFKQKSFGMFEARRNTPESASSESETLTDMDRASGTRLNPMAYEYWHSVVISYEEQKWEAAPFERPARPVKKTPRDYIDERIKDVLDARISNFETSLLIIQLLQGLRDYDTPAEQTPAVQVLKFALDTLWSLQFGIDNVAMTGIECATLKAAAARLMLTALKRVLSANEPTTAVIHNGLLPMTLRLLEDACSKPVNVFSSEEGSLVQEFIFATIYGIISFLYCLLHQQGTVVEKLSDFLELFQLFTESQDGKLLQISLIKVCTATGTCCCFPPRILMTSITTLLKKRDSTIYTLAIAFLERTFFKELGTYPELVICDTCDRPLTFSWDFLEMYADLLTPDDPKLCYAIMVHLLKIGTRSKFRIKWKLFLKVFYPTFLKAKGYYAADKENIIAKFLIQSCLSALSCLIVYTEMYQEFTGTNGLEEALTLLSDMTFTKNVYDLLEICVIVEMWTTKYYLNTEKPALKSLFNSLEKETTELLHVLENSTDILVDEKYVEQVTNQIFVIESMDQDAQGSSTTFQNDIMKEQNAAKGSTNASSCFPESLFNSEVNASCLENDDTDDSKKINLYQASAAWRAAAGVALCNPKFRTQLSSHSVSQKSLQLFIMLAIRISTDSITDTNKSAHRLFEALLTCCLTSPLSADLNPNKLQEFVRCENSPQNARDQ